MAPSPRDHGWLTFSSSEFCRALARGSSLFRTSSSLDPGPPTLVSVRSQGSARALSMANMQVNHRHPITPPSVCTAEPARLTQASTVPRHAASTSAKCVSPRRRAVRARRARSREQRGYVGRIGTRLLRPRHHACCDSNIAGRLCDFELLHQAWWVRADPGNRNPSIVSSSVKVVCQTSPGTVFKCRNNAKYLPVGADGLSAAPVVVCRVVPQRVSRFVSDMTVRDFPCCFPMCATEEDGGPPGRLGSGAWWPPGQKGGSSGWSRRFWPARRSA